MNQVCSADKECDSFRNAICSAGICTCGANECANNQGICVSKEDPDAFQEVGHPCLQSGDDFKLFTVKKDPSLGAPYSRCIVLGEKSHIRMAYPTLSEVKKNPTDVTVKANAKVGFSIIPFQMERDLAARLMILEDPITKEPSLQFSLTSEKTELFNEMTGLVGEGSKYEACKPVSASKARMVPIAEFCIKVTPKPASSVTKTTTTDKDADGNSVKRTIELADENEVHVSFCVPALFNPCHSIQIATIKKKTVKTQKLRSQRRLESDLSQQQRLLSETDSSHVTYEIDVDVPEEDAKMLPEQSAETDDAKKASLQPAIVVFIALIFFILLSTIMNYLVTNSPVSKYVQKVKSERSLKQGFGAPDRNYGFRTNPSIQDVVASGHSGEGSSAVMLALKEDVENSHESERLRGCLPRTLNNCTNWVPKDNWLRKALGDAYFVHIFRVFSRVPIMKTPLLPDEALHTKRTSYSILQFLSFRRSVLIVFVSLQALLCVMGFVQDGIWIMADIVNGVTDSDTDMTHADVRSVMGLFSGMVGKSVTTDNEEETPASDSGKKRKLSETWGGEQRSFLSGTKKFRTDEEFILNAESVATISSGGSWQGLLETLKKKKWKIAF